MRTALDSLWFAVLICLNWIWYVFTTGWVNYLFRRDTTVCRTPGELHDYMSHHVYNKYLSDYLRFLLCASENVYPVKITTTSHPVYMADYFIIEDTKGIVRVMGNHADFKIKRKLK